MTTIAEAIARTTGCSIREAREVEQQFNMRAEAAAYAALALHDEYESEWRAEIDARAFSILNGGA